MQPEMANNPKRKGFAKDLLAKVRQHGKFLYILLKFMVVFSSTFSSFKIINSTTADESCCWIRKLGEINSKWSTMDTRIPEATTTTTDAAEGQLDFKPGKK